RRTLFQDLERGALQRSPATPYEFASWKSGTTCGRPLPDSRPAEEPLQLVADDEPRPDERTIQVCDHLLQSALAMLPCKQRQAVTLAFLGDSSHQEVVAAPDLPLGTAKTRLRSGLERLRWHLAASPRPSP
ncbi:MAG: hypothetical protein JO057_23805, partial [Chloroflexi bacterium]|nr:hypothetical protein [Chloroflexota bacterium]